MFTTPIQVVYGSSPAQVVAAPWTGSFGTVQKSPIVVLTEDLGQFPAGLYADTGGLWKLALPGSDFNAFVSQGATFTVYINLSAPTVGGEVVYANGTRQSTSVVLADNRVWVSVQTTETDGLSFSVTQKGAKCDAVRTFGGGVLTAGSAVFTDPAAEFSGADVGKLFYVAGAGFGGKLLATTIRSFVDLRTVTLADAASVTVANAHYVYGTDDTSAWAAAAEAIGNKANCTITVPFGLSLTDGIALKNNASIVGSQPDGWAFRNLKRSSGLLLKPKAVRPALLYGTSFSVGNVGLEKLYLDGLAMFQGNTVVRYNGATTTAGSNAVVFTNGTFTAADVGKKIAIYGAGPGGTLQDAAYVGFITAVTDANNITLDDTSHPACYSRTDVRYAYGFADQQGVDGATTAASTVFNAASASFTADDVGKVIEIYACMAPLWGDGTLNNGDGLGETLVTHITAVNSPTQVVLHTFADLTVTNLRWRVGAQAGIYQPHSTISQDSMWHISRCVIANFAGNGYNCGLYQRANRFREVYFWQALGHGMWVRSSDNQFMSCMWAQCGEDGMYLAQSTNHFVAGDVFSNEGNGAFVGGYAGQSQFVAIMFDMNGRNGMLDFGVGTQRIGCRFTTNGISKNGTYSDVSLSGRTCQAGAVTKVNARGNGHVGCYHVLASPNGNKPIYGLFNIGPFGSAGTGVLYDSNSSPFTNGSINSPTATMVHQHSFQIEGGSTITLSANNILKFDTVSGSKIGSAAAEKIGFWGATPVARPTVTGSRGGNAALASLLTQLATAGLIVDSSSA